MNKKELHEKELHEKALHEKALQVAQRYRRCEIELIEVLEKVDAKKICYQHGCNSTFRYAVDVLGLSEAVALIFINVSRKTKEVPQLRDEIRKGRITVSKAQKMTSVLTPENSSKWIGLARESSTRQLEKSVAEVNPKSAVRESAKYVSKDRLQVQLGLSEKAMLKLRRVQDLLSQKRGHSVDLEEVLEEMSAEFLEKHDPVKKAKRQKARGRLQRCKQKTPHGKNTHRSSSKREPIPAATRHELYLKSKGQCMHPSCQSQRHLEIHHIVPVAKDGNNELKNLQLLCSGHHKIAHLIKPPPG